MIAAPIYKDTVYTHYGPSLSYSVILDGNTIFSGRAVAAPGESSISININRICENYLNNYNIDDILKGLYAQQTAYQAFRTFQLKESGGGVLETYKFLYNYDYGGVFSSEGMVLSDPITNKSAVNFIPIGTYFNGTYVNNLLDSNRYPESVCDADYALYYLNARGGWDGLVIEGNSTRTDKVSRHSYNKTYNNQTIEYEKNTYISEITTEWKLNTGILDDDQAHKLCWHLLASNRVYLHDLKANAIYPVVITNTQNIYNTYRNNGQQPIQYEIDVVESQTKLRQ